MSSSRDESYQAPALSKGLQVLEFLSAQVQPYALADLARALGKSRSEIYRMVIVLERLGYLVRTDSDRLVVSRKLFDLAMRAPPQRNLLARALPEMEKLALETFQSCHLTVASGADIVVVSRVESPDLLGFSVRVGYRRPLSQSASGRVLYAFQSKSGRAAMQAVAATVDLPDPFAEFEQEASAVREMGCYLYRSSYVDAVTDIAAPITVGADAIAIAVLVMPFIGGRSARLSIMQAASAVRHTAAGISREME